MNDTIVVFDAFARTSGCLRRENLSDIVNRSINQTLSRTVLTSGLTFFDRALPVPVWRRGAARLLAGPRDRIIIGTYSSILSPHRCWLPIRIGVAAAMEGVFRPASRYPARKDEDQGLEGLFGCGRWNPRADSSWDFPSWGLKLRKNL